MRNKIAFIQGLLPLKNKMVMDGDLITQLILLYSKSTVKCFNGTMIVNEEIHSGAGFVVFGGVRLFFFKGRESESQHTKVTRQIFEKHNRKCIYT